MRFLVAPAAFKVVESSRCIAPTRVVAHVKISELCRPPWALRLPLQ